MLGLNRGQTPRHRSHTSEQNMSAGEIIEEKYSKEIAGWAGDHDLDARDMTPEMRGRWRLFVRAENAGLPYRYAPRAEFIRRQVRAGRISDQYNADAQLLLSVEPLTIDEGAS